MRLWSIVCRAVTLCAALVVLVTAVPVQAQDGKVPYCPHTEPHAPHGIVLRMGQEYYRTCGNWTTGGGVFRQFILKVNPSQIPGLYSTYSPSNLRVMERTEGIDRLANAIRNLPKKDRRTIGFAQYDVYESKPLAPSGKPHRSTFVFAAEGSASVPRHWVNCYGWNRLEEGRSLNCTVYVQQGDVYGSLLFIGSHKRGLKFLDHFAGFAQDIERVLT
ncbi:hypothetical protein [Shimia biformata]|uniref:hypothetical protein n=1 Tax=Shimia biformata TaxID=1294299 RepID=UPI00194E9585|nr:hypothetical protein [Shimia biformata]